MSLTSLEDVLDCSDHKKKATRSERNNKGSNMKIQWKPERMVVISASAILSGSLATAYSMKTVGKAESRWSDATMQYNHRQPYSMKLPVPSILTPTKIQCEASNKPSPWPLLVRLIISSSLFPFQREPRNVRMSSLDCSWPKTN